MRIIIFTETRTEESFQEEIDFFKNKLYSQVDIFSSYETAEYCVDIRTYDLIFIEYVPKYHNKYYNIIGSLKKQGHAKSIYIFGKNLLRSKDLFERCDFARRIEGVNFSLIEQVENHMSTSEFGFAKEKAKVDLKKRTITVTVEENKEKNIKGGEKTVFLKKDFDFLILLYFVRHYGEIIKVSSLLDATCEEPEEKKDSLVEASISKIRKQFKCVGGGNPIRSLKKVGYTFTTDNIDYDGEDDKKAKGEK